MNKVILMGRLTRDPDIRYSQNDSQVSVARFTLAVDRRFKRDSEQTADFISCVAFGRTAEFFRDYMKQGTKVCVEGRIQTGSYTNKNGDTVYTTDVVANRVEFIDWGNNQNPNGSQGGYSQGSYSAPQAQPAPAPQSKAPVQDDDMPDSFEAIDEDVPF